MFLATPLLLSILSFYFISFHFVLTLFIDKCVMRIYFFARTGYLVRERCVDLLSPPFGLFWEGRAWGVWLREERFFFVGI